MIKVKFNRDEVIFEDDTLSDAMFFLHNGLINLYAENGMPFTKYKSGMHFGEVDMMLN